MTDDFYKLRMLAGFNDRKKLAEYLDVNVKTIKNWEKSNRPPKAVQYLLGLLAGELDAFGPAWKGFYWDGECICSNDGDHIWPGEIRALKWLYQNANVERTKLVKDLHRRGIINVKAFSNQKSGSL